MNWIIRQIAILMARRVEKGSPLVTAGGAFGGVVLGVLLAHLLHERDFLDRYWVGAAIAFAVVGGITGALVGSLIRPSGGPRDLPARAVSPLEPARLTNLNQALAPLFVLTLLTGLSIWAGRHLGKPVDAGGWIALVLLGAMLIGAGTMSIRAVLWLDIGREVVVRRLLTTTRYSRTRIVAWGFSPSRGTLVTRPMTQPVPFIITFDDGFRFERLVHPAKSAEVARVMNADHVIAGTVLPRAAGS